MQAQIVYSILLILLILIMENEKENSNEENHCITNYLYNKYNKL
jgi:hypothetical protein